MPHNIESHLRRGADSARLVSSEIPIKTLSINDACRALGIGRTAIYRLIGEGRVKAVKLAGRTLIAVSELDRLVQEALDSSDNAA
jgi:excisionase family DNA binding protein